MVRNRDFTLDLMDKYSRWPIDLALFLLDLFYWGYIPVVCQTACICPNNIDLNVKEHVEATVISSVQI